MIRDIENKKVNMVIVKDSSRLGRDYIQFGQYIEKYFPQNKVRVISILDNYDSEIANVVINEEQAKVVRKIFDLFLEGNSPLQISYILVNEKIPTPSQIMNMQKQTTKWYPEVIRRILKNEMYIGNMVRCKKRKINYKLKQVVDISKSE